MTNFISGPLPSRQPKPLAICPRPSNFVPASKTSHVPWALAVQLRIFEQLFDPLKTHKINPMLMLYVICSFMFFLNNKEHVKTWAIFRVLNLEYVYIYIPVVPHKAVAEVSKIGNLKERLVVVNHGWHSEATDGSKGDWCLLSFSLLFSLSLIIYLSIYLSNLT